jgi:hypothetical protein
MTRRRAMSHVKFFLFLVLILSTSSCKCVDEKEIKNWKWGSHKLDGTCPVGELPIYIWPTMKHHELMAIRKPLSRAVRDWNEAIGQTVFKFKYHPNAHPVYIATKKTLNYQKTCGRDVWLGDGVELGQEFPHSFGWHEWNNQIGYGFGFSLYVCLGKYQRAIKLIGPYPDKVRRLGLYTTIKHDLGHALIGPHHPKSYSELMGKVIHSSSIHYHTRQIIKRTVLDVCK